MSGDIYFERVNLGNCFVDLPQELCEQKSLFKEILSEETWNYVLSNEQRNHLMKFLPTFPDNDITNKQETIRELLSGENFRFGNPINEFHQKLKGGYFLPEVSQMNAVLHKAKHREYVHKQQRYFYKLLQEILISRRRLLDVASQLPPEQPLRMERIQPKPCLNSIEKRTKRRYLRELQDIRQEVGELQTSSEDESYPDFVAPKLTKRQKRHLAQLEASLSLEAGNVSSTMASKTNLIGNGVAETRSVRSISPFEVFEDDYRTMLMNHKRRRTGYEIHPELDVEGITLQDVEQRSNVPKRSSSKPVSFAMESETTSSKAKGNKEKERKKVSAVPQQPAPISVPLTAIKMEPGLTEATFPSSEPPLLIPKVELFANYPSSPAAVENNVLPQTIEPSFPDNSMLESELPAVETDFGFTLPRSSTPVLGHTNYASFFSMLRDFMCESYDSKVLPSKLEERVVSWQESPFSALNDWYPLHGNWSDLVVPALKFLSGQVAGPVPDNFIPLVDFKERLQFYRWSGEGRDSDENLTALSTFWLETRAEEIPVAVQDFHDSGSPPPPRVLTDWTVKQTTEEEKLFYREQERRRYETPHRAFTFFHHGYEAVVGPVKGVYGKDGTVAKAREHSLLVPDRPPFVTILSLVRDSAARLPNGEGTRADICELLKDSQFLALATDVQIHTVVSGALDRLHYEKDPCVKYDVNRKMWIYLHRCRTEDEFERIHQAQATTVKTKKVGTSKQKSKQTKNKTASRPASAMSTASSDSLLSLEAASSASSVVLSASSSPVSARATSSTTSRISNSAVSSSSSATVPPVLTSSAVTKVTISSTAKSTVPSSAFFQPLSTTVSQQAAVSVAQVTSVPTAVRGSPIAKTTKTEQQQDSVTSDVGVPSPSFIVPQASSRPSSTGSAHSLPSPKSVIANVNAAQLVNIAQVQLIGTTSSTSVMPITVSTASPKLNTNIVAQLTAVQQQQHHPHPKTVGAIMAQQAAANAAAAKAITVTTQSLGAVRLVPSGTNISHSNAPLTAKTISTPIAGHTMASHGTLQGVPTIVIKQEPGVGHVASTQQARGSIQGSKPVVARIISAPQVVSVGNLIASTLAATQKQGNPGQGGTTTIKIQGSNILHPMAAKGGHLNVLKGPNTSCPSISGVQAASMPRLALVSQGNTTNLIPVSGTTVTVQPKLMATVPGQIGIMTSQLTSQQGIINAQMSSVTKPAILTTPGGIKIMSATVNPSMTLAQLGGKATQTMAQPPTVTVSMGTTAGTTQNLILTGSMQSSSIPAVVIASQRALKPAQTVVMAQSVTTPTMVMAAQPTLRPIAATTVTSAGVKVIPVPQSTGIGKGKTQPVFTRIITPPAGLTLRPATGLTTSAAATQGVGLIHAVAAHMPTAGLMANAGTGGDLRHAASAAAAAIQQATIIRVQTPNMHPDSSSKGQH